MRIAVNEALSLASNPVVLKVDDHDSYPDDHADILKDWEPGVLLYGSADFEGCDGQLLWARGRPSAPPPSLRRSGFTGTRWGMITASVVGAMRSPRGGDRSGQDWSAPVTGRGVQGRDRSGLSTALSSIPGPCPSDRLTPTLKHASAGRRRECGRTRRRGGRSESLRLSGRRPRSRRKG